MKKAFAISLFFAAALFAQNYKIVGPKEPKPYEATAMKELTDYLAKRVKGDLTIGVSKSVTFHVGDTQLAEEKGLTSTKLPDEKWIVKSFGDDVVVNGGGLHGALYATYHFLEDCCDIHWWSVVADASHPRHERQAMLPLQEHPPWLWRLEPSADPNPQPLERQRRWRVREDGHGPRRRRVVRQSRLDAYAPPLHSTKRVFRQAS